MTPAPSAATSRMTTTERRASFSLASIYALRMLGLFLMLPVFVLEARHYPDGQRLDLIGLAMGAYGLAQALMQMPMGWASDRWGRKRIIVLGLGVFAFGSALAAWAPSVKWLIVARGIQGLGAVSAAVSALLSDLTRDSVRTKGMALVGASIGLTFAVSLVMAPLLVASIGLKGIFALTTLLALGGIGIVLVWTPPEPARNALATASTQPSVWSVLRHPSLWQLNVGVFCLHAVQVAMWMAVPTLLTQAGLASEHQWQVYLPAVLGSFVLMGGLFALERRGHLQWVLRGAVALLLAVEFGLLVVASGTPTTAQLGGLLFAFFISFNILEASQPSLVSKLAPENSRGVALGLYNTLQSLGLFVGGALGGWLVKKMGVQLLFGSCTLVVLAWLVLSWHLRLPKPQSTAVAPSAP